MIDILVLNYNDSETTSNFVKSVMGYPCIHKILVVDNHSSDNSLKKLKVLENDKVFVVDSGKNGGYGFGNNWGIQYLHEKFHSEHILICNPDVSFTEDTVCILSSFLKNNDDYAAVAPLMKIPGKGFQYSALKDATLFSFIMSVELIFSKFFSPLYLNLSNRKCMETVDVFSLPGSLFMIDINKFTKPKLYDENLFLYFEEFVLGRKLQETHYKAALLPNVFFIHNHSVSISKTYKGVVDKHLVYLRSYRYIVKTYFKSNLFFRGLSYVMSAISLFEAVLITLLKRLK